MESFTAWLDREYRYAATAMMRSFSATDIVKARPGFGHTMHPAKGSIIASPIPASYDPDPDYFFHWYRDSAVVIDALRVLFESGDVGPGTLEHVRDFVRFSLSLRSLEGRELVAKPEWRAGVSEDFKKFVRDDAELAGIHGDAVAADTRVNPNGTLDISKWARPQHDGPPLRALAMLRWARGAAPLEADVKAQMAELIRADLAFTFAHAQEPSFDIWEEENGHHYYTLCVSAAALSEGADWLADVPHAPEYRAASEAIRRALAGYWSPEGGYYRSRVMPAGVQSTKELDIAVILAAIHAAGDANPHIVHDPHMHATLAKLEALFDAAYPINHQRPEGRGTAMGRYAGDVYYSGGAFYFSTLGAAEFCYRAASGREDAPIWVKKGDAFLATVRAFTPSNGELSEQFDQRTGLQTSAKHLAWSYAAFISCVHARRAVAGL